MSRLPNILSLFRIVGFTHAQHPADGQENQGNGKATEATDCPPQPTVRLEGLSQTNH